MHLVLKQCVGRTRGPLDHTDGIGGWGCGIGGTGAGAGSGIGGDGSGIGVGMGCGIGGPGWGYGSGPGCGIGGAGSGAGGVGGIGVMCPGFPGHMTINPKRSVRQAHQTPRRLAEAARLGFVQAIVPRSAPEPPAGIRALRASTVGEALALASLPLP